MEGSDAAYCAIRTQFAPREVLAGVRRAPRGFGARRGITEITDRSRSLTALDESNTAATSGSNTIATTLPPIRAANRFGREFA